MNIKKAIGTTVGMGMFLISAFPVLADTTCDNHATGPFSYNRCDIRNRIRSRVSLSNDADVHNDVDAHVNTGHNEADFNTLGGSVHTGNASASVLLLNDVNTTNLDVDQSWENGDTHASNHLTGPFSDNIIRVSNSQSLNVSVDNDAHVENSVNAHVNTGGNSASFNTIGGDIDTGDATLDVVAHTVANQTTVSVSQ